MGRPGEVNHLQEALCREREDAVDAPGLHGKKTDSAPCFVFSAARIWLELVCWSFGIYGGNLV